MQERAPEIDVLIVGAGPVGLFLANECARRSLRYRIVEARSTQSQHSKALAVMPRTAEIFDMAGLVQPFLDAANRVPSVAVVSHQHRLAHIAFEPKDTVYPFIAMVPQDVTERLLVEALRAKGGDVEYETSFVSAVQHDDVVEATVERNGQAEVIHATFVVGCDGAHSAVRRLLNLPFEGAEYHDSFILADVQTNEALPRDEMQLCPHETGALAIFPMSSTRRRIVATVDEVEGDAPPLSMVRAVAEQRAPRGFEVRDLTWSSYFRIHHRQVAQLRVGRMFVAGDAAHIHSPFGGQGMNTGLQDVWNLVWKLDLAVRGRATEKLLDSYNAERRPVIQHVVETTDRITKVMNTPNKFAQGVRDVVIPVVSRFESFQHAFVQTLSELGVNYAGSPIVEGHGYRSVDESLRGGNGILSRYVLFIGADDDDATVAEATNLNRLFPDTLEIRTAAHDGIALVRPDGYTAYESPHGFANGSVKTVRELLERQITT